MSDLNLTTLIRVLPKLLDMCRVGGRDFAVIRGSCFRLHDSCQKQLVMPPSSFAAKDTGCFRKNPTT
jgi:hypothetical protein